MISACTARHLRTLPGTAVLHRHCAERWRANVICSWPHTRHYSTRYQDGSGATDNPGTHTCSLGHRMDHQL